LDPALASYDQAAAVNPADALAFCNRGTLLRRLRRSAEALASYDQAIAAKSDYAEAYFNRGMLLTELERSKEALASYERAIEIAPGFAQAHLRRGALLFAMKKFDEALASYDKAIEITPRFAEAYSYRGALLQEREQLDAALDSYNKAIEIDPGHAEAYYNRGVLLQERKQTDAALADYDKAIAIIPHFAEAHSNRGGLLHARSQFDAALASYDKAIELDPKYAEAYLNRGILLMHLRKNGALASFDRAVALAPASADAHYYRAQTLILMRQFDAAVASFDRVLELRPNYRSVAGMRSFLKMALCDWRDFASDISRLTAAILGNLPLSGPMPIVALLDQPSLQHRAAQIWAREEFAVDHALPAITVRASADRIRIGYFSADFREHAVAVLTAEVFETHDRSKFEVIAFSFGQDGDDPIRRRLQQAFDRFIDVGGMSDEEVALLARSTGIDIAVDLSGYTQGSRTRIFAMRAAPIQINYLGYPGTMGTGYMDYLIGDLTVIPETQRRHYSEKIVYLPNSYLPNDSTREVADTAFTREQCGLPSEGIVFCCFNNSYKISPSTFDGWMRILERVPHSVLWLSQNGQSVSSNLRQEASRRGVRADRLIFAERVASPAEHLGRHRLADLFLDTLPYNAHATAVDALWAGLPVLTRLGEGFAGRVAASLLKSIELPELITSAPEQYEDLAVLLATDRQRLAAIRQKLAENRHRTPLFDTRSFTYHLESAYTKIWARYQAGLAPQHIVV
jgi:predicted O-linked N-acetylglucosamine transferase (SPINDLY family)